MKNSVPSKGMIDHTLKGNQFVTKWERVLDLIWFDLGRRGSYCELVAEGALGLNQ